MRLRIFLLVRKKLSLGQKQQLLFKRKWGQKIIVDFSFAQRKRIDSLCQADLESEVFVCGFISARRDHGGVLFLDLRDETGIVQIVVHPETTAFKEAQKLHLESVVGVQGELKKRPAGTENPKLSTGEWEINTDVLSVFSMADPLPFMLEDKNVEERVRYRFRYIDLRRQEMQQTFRMRSQAYHLIRSFLHEQRFVELDTPNLIRSTPEGARDFLVPSRFFPGKFYALPQSPQLFKQIFMASGFERYFQIVHCFRDEDLRLDRQPEFTQLDLEMAFVDSSLVKQLVEKLMHYLFHELLGLSLSLPFSTLSYRESLQQYGTDTPDIRFPYPLKDVTSLFPNTSFNVFQQVLKHNGMIKGLNLKGQGSSSRSFLDNLTQQAISLGAKGLAWFQVRGDQLHSPIAKFLSGEEQAALRKEMEAQDGDLLLFVADREKIVDHVLSSLTAYLLEVVSLDASPFSFVWIEDFPLFAFSETEQQLTPVHHPFTAPHPADLSLLRDDPLKARAAAYDLVLNGVEVGGGSLRIFDPNLQRTIFEILHFSPERIEQDFGFFLKALSFGVPPHGGLALGIDRLLMLMLGKSSLREVIPFPKTQTGVCLLSESPYEATAEQLRELHLKLREK